MVNWTKLIEKNRVAVKDFATGNSTSEDFQRDFSGRPNPARNVVRNYGTAYARKLARKALKRQGIGV